MNIKEIQRRCNPYHRAALVLAGIAFILSLLLPHFLFVITDSHLEFTLQVTGPHPTDPSENTVTLAYTMRGDGTVIENREELTLSRAAWKDDIAAYRSSVVQQVYVPDESVFTRYLLTVNARHADITATETFELLVVPRILYFIFSSTAVKILLILSLLLSVIGAIRPPARRADLRTDGTSHPQSGE